MFRSILVPLDGSPFAEHALPVAAGLARRAGAGLHLAEVFSPVILGDDLAIGTDINLRHREEEQTYLSSVVHRLRKATGTVAAAKLLDGGVAEALQEHALALKADLVVMTTHGRGPLSKFWPGSVSHQMVQRLPLPVPPVRAK